METITITQAAVQVFTIAAFATAVVVCAKEMYHFFKEIKETKR